MATPKSAWALLVVGLVVAGILGLALPVGAEELHYKFYTYVMKQQEAPVADVPGHTVSFYVRGAFYAFDTGEVATINHVATGDLINGNGPFMQYVTINFPDKSTITIKSQGTLGAAGAAGGWTSEILKGTGRFEGIKGTQSAKATYLPVEPGEAGSKGYGEGTIMYTLPGK